MHAICFAGIVLYAMSTDAHAQAKSITSPEIVLGQRTTYAAPFKLIRGVRELADGSVLVIDTATLFHVATTSSAATTVGTRGRGAGQYQSAGRLFPMHGDSTALWIGTIGPLRVLDGATFTDRTATSLVTTPGVALAGADTLGYQLLRKTDGQTRLPGPGGSEHVKSTFAVVRMHVDSQTVDTVGRISGGETVFVPVTGTPGVSQRGVTNPYNPVEYAVMFADGWAAIAYATPYRVQWIRPDGSRAGGAPIKYTPTPFDQRERLALMTTFKPYADSRQYYEQMKVLPPFITRSGSLPDGQVGSNVVIQGPGGTLLIRRTLRSDAARARYDVIDRSGNVAAFFTVPRNEYVVGSTEKSLYLANIDRTGVQHLQRVAWPTPAKAIRR